MLDHSRDMQMPRYRRCRDTVGTEHTYPPKTLKHDDTGPCVFHHLKLCLIKILITLNFAAVGVSLFLAGSALLGSVFLLLLKFSGNY